MPYNLLLLPLLGGYWFITISLYFRFKYLQLDRTHLLLWSATAGLILAAIAHIVCVLVIRIIPNYVELLKLDILPWDYAGTSILALLMGPFIAWISNQFVSKNDARDQISRDAIIKHGNNLERFLVDAHKHGRLVFLSLMYGKVYVTYLLMSPADMEQRDAWLKILPLYSGCRSPDDKKVIFTTDYSEVIEDDVDSERYVKLIRTDDIMICSKFEQDVWDGFNHNKNRSEATLSED